MKYINKLIENMAQGCMIHEKASKKKENNLSLHRILKFKIMKMLQNL